MCPKSGVLKIILLKLSALLPNLSAFRMSVDKLKIIFIKDEDR